MAIRTRGEAIWEAARETALAEIGEGIEANRVELAAAQATIDLLIAELTTLTAAIAIVQASIGDLGTSALSDRVAGLEAALNLKQPAKVTDPVRVRDGGFVTRQDTGWIRISDAVTAALV